MLQRVQSVFLLGVAICMGLVLLFPIWEKTDDDKREKVVLDAFTLTYAEIENEKQVTTIEEQQTVLIAILVTLSIINAFYSIFRYDNRLTQIKLGALNSLFMAGVLGLELYYSQQGEAMLTPNVQGNYDFGFFLPGIALLLNIMANRFIRRDENLVRSVNRIR